MSNLVHYNSTKLLAEYPLDINDQQLGVYAYAFQLKGPRQKDHYSTLAVFCTLIDAYNFYDSFPSIPGCSVRIMSDDKRILHRVRYQVKESVFSIGSLAWMLEQSAEITNKIVNKSQPNNYGPKLPKFSIRNIANKSLKSFQNFKEETKYLFGFSY